jgi:hypothetical protein
MKQRLPLALAILAVALVSLVVLYLVARPLATDDLWFHLKMGEVYAEQGLWPVTDPMLFTAGPLRPVQHSWLFGVWMHEVESIAGLQGLRVVHVLLVAAILALAYSTLRREAPSAVLALAGLLTFLVLSWFRLFQLRPDLVSILCTLLLYRLLLEGEAPVSVRRIFAAALLLVVWANAHSVFMLGFFLIVAVLAGLATRAFAARLLPELGPASAPGRRAAWLVVAAAVGLVATFLNPRGLQQHLTFFTSATTTAVLSVADEWYPFEPFLVPLRAGPVLTPLAWGLTNALLVALAVVLVVGLVRFLRTPTREVLDTYDPVHAALAAASAVAMLSALRFLWLAFFIVLFLLHVLRHSVRARAHVGRRLELAVALAMLLVALVFPSQIGFASFVDETREQGVSYFGTPYLRQRYAAPGMEFLRETGIEGNVYNPYHLGGFLGYWLSPRIRTFIDGRTEHYPPEILEEYEQIRFNAGDANRPANLAILDRRGVDVFFAAGRPYGLSYANTYTVPRVEGDPRWLLVFRARDHAIYLRRDARNAPNLRRVQGYYARQGIRFDPEKGFDVAALVATRPEWLIAHEILPPHYPQLLADRDGSDPTRRFRALSELGSIYSDLGDWTHQIPVERAAVAMRPDALLERTRLITTLVEQGSPVLALHQARELVRLHPESERARELLQRVEAVQPGAAPASP